MRSLSFVVGFFTIIIKLYAIDGDIKGESISFIGIKFYDTIPIPIDFAQKQKFGIPNESNGQIKYVLPHSPAYLAGIKKDDVIVLLNKKPFELSNFLNFSQNNSKILKFGVIRDQKFLTIHIKPRIVTQNWFYAQFEKKRTFSNFPQIDSKFFYLKSDFLESGQYRVSYAKTIFDILLKTKNLNNYLCEFGNILNGRKILCNSVNDLKKIKINNNFKVKINMEEHISCDIPKNYIDKTQIINCLKFELAKNKTDSLILYILFYGKLFKKSEKFHTHFIAPYLSKLRVMLTREIKTLLLSNFFAGINNDVFFSLIAYHFINIEDYYLNAKVYNDITAKIDYSSYVYNVLEPILKKYSFVIKKDLPEINNPFIEQKIMFIGNDNYPQ